MNQNGTVLENFSFNSIMYFVFSQVFPFIFHYFSIMQSFNFHLLFEKKKNWKKLNKIIQKKIKRKSLRKTRKILGKLLLIWTFLISAFKMRKTQENWTVFLETLRKIIKKIDDSIEISDFSYYFHWKILLTSNKQKLLIKSTWAFSFLNILKLLE